MWGIWERVVARPRRVALVRTFMRVSPAPLRKGSGRVATGTVKFFNAAAGCKGAAPVVCVGAHMPIRRVRTMTPEVRDGR
jgi:hypothetical protein